MPRKPMFEEPPIPKMLINNFVAFEHCGRFKFLKILFLYLFRKPTMYYT